MREQRNDRPRLAAARGAGWWFPSWGGRRIRAGVTDRRTDPARLLEALGYPVTAVSVEQAHGGSVAVIQRCARAVTVAGCDALVTRTPGVALLVRTADCLPLAFADPRRGVIGIAHAGWRGMMAGLLARVVRAFHTNFHTPPHELEVAIGPAIRACCYEVGPEFLQRFGTFVQTREGRRTCDLVGIAQEQLARCGIQPARIVDSGCCTACEADRWFSWRREGAAAGRMVSLIALRP